MLRRTHKTTKSALNKAAQKQELTLLNNHDKIKKRSKFHLTLIKEVIEKGKLMSDGKTKGTPSEAVRQSRLGINYY